MKSKYVRIYRRGDRGFHAYGRPFECSYGTLMEVYESSSAEGPHCLLAMWSLPQLTGNAGEALAHLTPEQAEALVARLRTWLDEPKRRPSR